MNALRIIPCLDIKNGRVVKGVNFENIRDAGDPVELAARYMQEGADEIVFLDITASHETRRTAVELASNVAEELFIPFTVGGGISSENFIADVLKAGADKISLNTSAVEDPGLITRASKRFGNQCIAVAVDAQRFDNGWHVYTQGGRVDSGLDAVKWAKAAERAGAGELLLTSMDRDGTLGGYDLELIEAVSSAVRVPVIASGGAGEPEHLAEAASAGAAALLVASIVHDRRYSIADLKAVLKGAGHPVRM